MSVEINEILNSQNEFSPPRFFQHEDLIKSFNVVRSLNQEELVNTINYLHFKGSPLFILLQHPVFANKMLATAHQDPCLGNQLTCRWDESYFKHHLTSYMVVCLVIIDNTSMIISPFHQLHWSEEGFTLQLPEKSHALNQRQAIRYSCTGIWAELMQSDFIVRGELKDFSSSAFRIRIDSNAVKNNCSFNPHVSASIRLYSQDKIIYTDRCRSIRCQNESDKSFEIVFASESQYTSRVMVQSMPIRLTQNRRILRDSYVFSCLRKRPCRSAIPLWWQSSAHYRKLPLARIVG